MSRSTRAVGAHLRVVAHPLQQPVRDARCPTRPARDLGCAFGLERDAEDPRRAHEDRLELGSRVVVESGDEPEPVAQRAGDHPAARGRADEREPGQVEPDRARRRTLADDDVELEVLHRRVQDLLDLTREPVDLVDEQHVAVVEVGEDRRQVAGALERRSAGDPEAHVELGGHDPGHAGLAQPGRAGEQHVVERLAAPVRCAQHDLEVLAQRGLADELVESARPQRRLLGALDRDRQPPGAARPSPVRVRSAHARTVARTFSASRSRSSTGPSSGMRASTSRISSGE